MAQFDRRDWGVGNAVLTTLSAQLSAGASSATITASTNWPDGTDGSFLVGLAPTTDLTNPSSSFELIECSGRTGTTLTIANRGAGGTSDQTHASGTRAWIMAATRDFDEANKWVSELAGAISAAGDLAVGDGNNSLTTLANGTDGLPLVAGASTPAYEELGTSGLADGAVTAVKTAPDVATQAELDAHTGDATDAHHASAISFSPVGTIAGTDTQTAVAEVATDAATALASHEADTTSVHGIADTAAIGDANLAAAIPRGVLPNGYAEVTANQLNLDAAGEDITGLSVTVTVGTSRRIRITGHVAIHAGAAFPNIVSVGIHELTTVLDTASANGGGESGTGPITLEAKAIETPNVGEHTYKLVGASVGGLGDLIASATRPAFILVEDIGAA